MKSAIKKEWNYEAAYELPQAANANKQPLLRTDQPYAMSALEKMAKHAEQFRLSFIGLRGVIPAVTFTAANSISSGFLKDADVVSDLARTMVFTSACYLVYQCDKWLAPKIKFHHNVFTIANRIYNQVAYEADAKPLPKDTAKLIVEEAVRSLDDKPDLAHKFIRAALSVAITSIAITQIAKQLPPSVKTDFKKSISIEAIMPRQGAAKSGPSYRKPALA